MITITGQACLYDKPKPLASCNIPPVVTYSGVIKPIIATHCTSCHSGTAVNGGGVRLDEHSFLIMKVTQPLMNAINHTGTVTPMPKDAGKLDACTIAKIKKWIDDGALNN